MESERETAGNKGNGRMPRPAALGLFGLLAALLLLAAGCAGGEQPAGETGGRDGPEGRLKVAASFYPLYDFAKKIGGEHADVVNLVPAGVDSHDWSPKLQDMKRISEADVFLYLGAGYEGWVDDFLAALNGGDGPLAVEAARGAELIRLSGRAGAHAAASGEADGPADGSGHGHDHENGHEHDNNHGHDHGHDVDPHVWLSPKQAAVLADNIKDAFAKADPDHRADYEARHAELLDRLRELDGKLQTLAAEASQKTFIVSHESFGYLARDYGLTQLGVMGLSPDAEPTAKKLREIRETAERLGIRYILFEELVSPRVAETLAASLGIETLVLNPLEGLTEEQLAAGDDYFTVMERNLTTLAIALD